MWTFTRFLSTTRPDLEEMFPQSSQKILPRTMPESRLVLVARSLGQPRICVQVSRVFPLHAASGLGSVASSCKAGMRFLRFDVVVDIVKRLSLVIRRHLVFDVLDQRYSHLGGVVPSKNITQKLDLDLHLDLCRISQWFATSYQ